MSRDNLDNETLLSQTQREGSHDVLPPVYGNSHDMEGLEEEFKSFNDSNVRLGFIRKVYSLLFCQLICTTGVVAGFLYVPNAQNFVQSNPWYVSLLPL
ncbi:hypothetical protein SARC_04563 [Sphaeroforma arctica JP610]|uniref:Uncharacterized protein n=1 Tax=Sphaeroforma arctica JP610 TaxID=667725 RepID=A0A0L0G220_9EUKA|nr:hypothetical protein SARC_04563 [Sphaeroforma arctica JP610]KNC83177.1 hypothetical protein SARC_04563 [Sphaeroforma arctica JP610]|eukprot:XP_014157079.1 hypothetical protein SARC_04563 [Sphaeroforma arctica JP610]